MVGQDSSITSGELLQLVQSLVNEVRPNFPASQRITLDSTFEKDLGLDSLARVQLIARVESKYHLALPESSFAEAETTRDLIRAISKAESSPNLLSKPQLQKLPPGYCKSLFRYISAMKFCGRFWATELGNARPRHPRNTLSHWFHQQIHHRYVYCHPG